MPTLRAVRSLPVKMSAQIRLVYIFVRTAVSRAKVFFLIITGTYIGQIQLDRHTRKQTHINMAHSKQIYVYKSNSESFSPENHTDILRKEVSRTYILNFNYFICSFNFYFIQKFITKINAQKEVYNVRTNAALILYMLPL
jgi:hypothetical protein